MQYFVNWKQEQAALHGEQKVQQNDWKMFIHKATTPERKKTIRDVQWSIRH